MPQLQDRIAIVTGSGIGIGRAVAIKLAAEGAKVIVADINEELGNATTNQINIKQPGSALFIRTDVTDETSINNCVEETAKRFGSIHILVNNAVRFIFGHLKGVGNGSRTGTDRDVTQEDWQVSFQTNVIGYANFIKAVVRHMRNNPLTDVKYHNDQGQGVNTINAGSRGSIVNMGSIGSFVASTEFVPYSITKGAVLQLTKCCAMDLAEWKIRVNMVSPGTVETPGSYNYMKQINISIDEGRKKLADATLLKRQAAPEEIANVVSFLASDQASFMTGAQVVADGGQTI